MTFRRGSTASRALGVTAALVAAISLALTAVAVAQTWRIERRVSNEAVAFLTRVDETLRTTNDALDVADEALETTSGNLDALGATLQSVASTIDASRSTVGDVGAMLQVEVPSSVRSAQTAIASAQRTAGLIDDTMARISRLPLVGSSVDAYQPEVGLADALGDVGRSLDPMPPALSSVGRSLETASGDLGGVARNLVELGDEVETIDASVAGAKAVVDAYRTQLDGYRDMVDEARGATPWLLRTTALGLTFMWLWLAVVQVWVLRRGITVARAVVPPEDGGDD